MSVLEFAFKVIFAKIAKLATLNLKLASLRIPKAIGQRRRKLEGNRVGKKTTLQIWWISFVIKNKE